MTWATPLIVVEHDEEMMRAADWIIDIGPGAGEHGGEVVASGPIESILASARIGHGPVSQRHASASRAQRRRRRAVARDLR